MVVAEKIGSHFCRDKQAKKGLEGEKPNSSKPWLRINSANHEKRTTNLKTAKF